MSGLSKEVCGIYRITNLINRKVYVGSSKRVWNRWYYHRSRLRNNKHCNIVLQRSWNKNEENSFEFGILETCPEEDLDAREQFWIKDLHSANSQKGYNLRLDARSNKGMCFASEALKRLHASNVGSKRSEVTLARMREIRAERGPVSLQARANMSLAAKKTRCASRFASGCHKGKYRKTPHTRNKATNSRIQVRKT